MTWARIPHFFSTPYYVYQYATCFASTARLMQDLRSPDRDEEVDGVERYLALLRAGGSGYPMDLLARPGWTSVSPIPSGRWPPSLTAWSRSSNQP